MSGPAIRIHGNSNNSNLLLESANGSINSTEKESNLNVLNKLNGLDISINELFQINRTTADRAAAALADRAATAVADEAAAVAVEAAAAEILAIKTSLLPVLDQSGSLHGIAKDLNVKVISEFGDSRALVLNKYNDLITVDNVTNEVYIMRFGDYTNNKFVALESPQKKVLLNKDNFVGWEPLDSGYLNSTNVFGMPVTSNNKPIHGIALRHYPANSISNESSEVTKIFVATEFAVYCWDYDDSTKYNAYNNPLTNGQLLVNRITCGIDTGYDYGPVGHGAHDLLFNISGDLHISSGSFGNIDIGVSGDLSGVLTDERSSVKYVLHDDLKTLLSNNESAPLAYDSSVVKLLARGLRNAAGLGLDASDNVWCVNMGFDSVEISGVIAPNGKVLWDSNPADTVFKLARARSNKRYGFPYAFHSATDLSVNETTILKNNLIYNPTKAEAVADAFGRPIGPFINPFFDASINDPELFVQNAEAIFEKSSSPLQIVFNSADNNGYLIYDGRSDHRLVKTKSIAEDFALITLKGSWNRLRGSDGAGFKLVSMDTQSYDISDVYYNSTFSSGWNEFSGLSNAGALQGELVAPSVYRPTGVILDKNGTVLVGSNYAWMSQPNRGGTIVAIY